MKKYIIVFSLLISFFFTFNITSSASETTPIDTNSNTKEVSELPDAGITPDHFLYSFDKFFENVSLKLTFSDEKRAEKLSRFAEERLAELNSLDAEAAQKYSDELFNEYGLDVEKANLYVQKLVSEGKISQEKLERIQRKVQQAEMKQEKIRAEVKEHISQEIKNKINEAIQNAKMSIFSKFNNLDQIKALHEEGYGYGVLLKLQAISDLSTKTFDELLQIENAVTTTDNNDKVVNIDTILQATNISYEDFTNKLVEYRTEAKTEMKAQIEEAKQNAQQRREEIKQQVKSRIQSKKNNSNQNNN